MLEGFGLSYASYLHGWSLETLYSRTAECSPCIILLQTSNPRAVIGMYMSVPISPPSNEVRGNGECFFFRLDGNSPCAYRWEMQKPVSMNAITHVQFAVCSKSFLSFGASDKHGTNALRINQDLTSGFAGMSYISTLN